MEPIDEILAAFYKWTSTLKEYAHLLQLLQSRKVEADKAHEEFLAVIAKHKEK